MLENKSGCYVTISFKQLERSPFSVAFGDFQGTRAIYGSLCFHENCFSEMAHIQPEIKNEMVNALCISLAGAFGNQTVIANLQKQVKQSRSNGSQ
mgnify:CR=1